MNFAIINGILAALKSLQASWVTSGRFTVDRLPAMTDEKIWKGTGGNVEEVDIPAAGKSIEAIASNTVANANDTERIKDCGVAYSKIKEIKLDTNMGGTVRIVFDCLRWGGAATAFFKLYRNGVAIGIERQPPNQVYPNIYSEDFDASAWVATDLIQLYAYDSEGGGRENHCKNMRLQYDMAFAVTNQDP